MSKFPTLNLGSPVATSVKFFNSTNYCNSSAIANHSKIKYQNGDRLKKILMGVDFKGVYTISRDFQPHHGAFTNRKNIFDSGFDFAKKLSCWEILLWILSIRYVVSLSPTYQGPRWIPITKKFRLKTSSDICTPFSTLFTGSLIVMFVCLSAIFPIWESSGWLP